MINLTFRKGLQPLRDWTHNS